MANPQATLTVASQIDFKIDKLNPRAAFLEGLNKNRERYGKILSKIAAKFGARETLLALGDFNDVDIVEELKEKNEIEKCLECGSKNLDKGTIWVCKKCGESCSDEIATREIAKILDKLLKTDKEKKKNGTN